MLWDRTYSSDNRLWGDGPSELALFVSHYLQQSSLYQGRKLEILDMGCGYGRDAMYLAQKLKCDILGIDNSEKAISLARENCPKGINKHIEFLPCDFSQIIEKYDIIFASNVYQLLTPDEREQMRETITRCLKVGGSLFLSTLSIRDPQLYGKGNPVTTENNSFQAEKFHHFSTRAELENDFAFLKINALFEREYREAHASGEFHRHISWILSGRNG